MLFFQLLLIFMYVYVLHRLMVCIKQWERFQVTGMTSVTGSEIHCVCTILFYAFH